jgi:hypothetical protein
LGQPVFCLAALHRGVKKNSVGCEPTLQNLQLFFHCFAKARSRQEKVTFRRKRDKVW